MACRVRCWTWLCGISGGGTLRRGHGRWWLGLVRGWGWVLCRRCGSWRVWARFVVGLVLLAVSPVATAGW